MQTVSSNVDVLRNLVDHLNVFAQRGQNVASLLCEAARSFVHSVSEAVWAWIQLCFMLLSGPSTVRANKSWYICDIWFNWFCVCVCIGLWPDRMIIIAQIASSVVSIAYRTATIEFVRWLHHSSTWNYRTGTIIASVRCCWSLFRTAVSLKQQERWMERLLSVIGMQHGRPLYLLIHRMSLSNKVFVHNTPSDLMLL